MSVPSTDWSSTLLLTLAHVEASGSGGEQPLLGGGSRAQRSDGGSVPATVHVLVHLLGNLLSMAEVRCRDGDSVEEAELRRRTQTKISAEKDGASTHCIMTTMLWTLMVCRVQ